MAKDPKTVKDTASKPPKDERAWEQMDFDRANSLETSRMKIKGGYLWRLVSYEQGPSDDRQSIRSVAITFQKN